MALALALPGAGCCLNPPAADVILDLGFRSPEQTLLTFQTGMRGDLPRLEYACLSSAFRAREGLSQLAYREFRDRWMSENPWLRKGVAEADLERREDLGPGAVRLYLSSYGQRFELVLVREDFVQAYSGERLLHDELLERLSLRLGTEPRADGGREVFADATLPLGTGDAPVTELRVGSEWKIDDVRETTDPAPPLAAR